MEKSTIHSLFIQREFHFFKKKASKAKSASLKQKDFGKFDIKGKFYELSDRGIEWLFVMKGEPAAVLFEKEHLIILEMRQPSKTKGLSWQKSLGQ